MLPSPIPSPHPDELTLIIAICACMFHLIIALSIRALNIMIYIAAFYTTAIHFLGKFIHPHGPLRSMAMAVCVVVAAGVQIWVNRRERRSVAEEEEKRRKEARLARLARHKLRGPRGMEIFGFPRLEEEEEEEFPVKSEWREEW